MEEISSEREEREEMAILLDLYLKSMPTSELTNIMGYTGEI